MHARRRDALVLFVSASVALSAAGCFAVRPSSGGGQTDAPPRRVNPADVVLPDGYRIEAVATGLTFPTGVAFDDRGRPHVTEAGYSYGEKWTTPRLLRIEADGSATVVASGDRGPWNGVDFHGGAFYVAQGGELEGGRIVRVAADGRQEVLVDNLPSVGDHHTNGPRAGRDGWVYFGVGTATNSGVVGTDAAKFGWLKRHPRFHDVPARDVTLAGQNFTTDNPLTPDKRDRAVTGAYLPFGTPSTPGQVIKGQTPCNGAVMRVRPEGGGPEVVAWGLRNPFGLAFSPEGKLYVTENSFDVRGSRPVWGSGDVLWEVDVSQPGKWYGWPDFHGGTPLTKSDHYTAPGKKGARFLLASHPNDPPQPVVKLGVHGSADGLDFAPDGAPFGYGGDAFIAQFGDMAPAVGKTLAPVGFNVVRVDVRNGTIHDFSANRAKGGKRHGPASRLKSGGLERPVAVRFSPDGSALYVVDFGVMTIGKDPHPREATGVLWRITKEGGR
jgi:glucose/arabinose dehydrogenase